MSPDDERMNDSMKDFNVRKEFTKYKISDLKLELMGMTKKRFMAS